eukprot:3591396-Pyramimonas_sp.AAC.1
MRPIGNDNDIRRPQLAKGKKACEMKGCPPSSFPLPEGPKSRSGGEGGRGWYPGSSAPPWTLDLPKLPS